MAITEREVETLSDIRTDIVNPYSLDLSSPEIHELTRSLLSSETPFIDSHSNPDINSDGKNLVIYKLEGSHPASDISRAIEGAIIHSDWQQDPDTTQEDEGSFEGNSTFFLVIDATEPNDPKPAASLRIADCLAGPCETVQYFQEVYGDEVELPDELKISDEDAKTGLWDVVGVMALDDYRNGITSAWAYYALYKGSLETGVSRWISNITDEEYANLQSIGTPFFPIEGVEKATYERKVGEPIRFGFYSLLVDDIHPDVSRTIEDLEAIEEGADFYRFVAKIARIAISGRFS